MTSKNEGLCLKTKMLKCGVSQVDLGRKVGKSQSTISFHLSKAFLKPMVYRMFDKAIDEIAKEKKEAKKRD